MRSKEQQGKTAAIVGAGIIGICCAIALAKRGHAVTLIDGEAPGSKTSRWNAGVMATSSVIPLNNPSLFRKIPLLMTGRYPGFTLDLRAVAATVPWSTRFLRNALPGASRNVTHALQALISHSRSCHEAICQDAGLDPWKSGGWLIAYRGGNGHRLACAHAATLRQAGVKAEPLTASEVRELEPAFMPIFGGAVHVVETRHTDPEHVIRTYLKLAEAKGVKILRDTVSGIARSEQGLNIVGASGPVGTFDEVVLSNGAWTRRLLQTVGLDLPMVVERGYLQKFACETAPRLPTYDVKGGYVVAPRPGGVQISTGTELTALDTAPRPKIFETAKARAKEALALDGAEMSAVEVGNRPSLPDSLPVIGGVKSIPGLWIAAGHQHIGLSTSAGTADLLATLMDGGDPPIDPKPYAFNRFRGTSGA